MPTLSKPNFRFTLPLFTLTSQLSPYFTLASELDDAVSELVTSSSRLQKSSESFEDLTSLADEISSPSKSEAHPRSALQPKPGAASPFATADKALQTAQREQQVKSEMEAEAAYLSAQDRKKANERRKELDNLERVTQDERDIIAARKFQEAKKGLRESDAIENQEPDENTAKRPKFDAVPGIDYNANGGSLVGVKRKNMGKGKASASTNAHRDIMGEDEPQEFSITSPNTITNVVINPEEEYKHVHPSQPYVPGQLTESEIKRFHDNVREREEEGKAHVQMEDEERDRSKVIIEQYDKDSVKNRRDRAASAMFLQKSESEAQKVIDGSLRGKEQDMLQDFNALEQEGAEAVTASSESASESKLSPKVVVVGMKKEHETAVRAVNRLQQVDSRYNDYLSRLEAEKRVIERRQSKLRKAQQEADRLEKDVDLSRKTIAGLELQSKELLRMRKVWRDRLIADLVKLNKLAKGHTKLANAMGGGPEALGLKMPPPVYAQKAVAGVELGGRSSESSTVESLSSNAVMSTTGVSASELGQKEDQIMESGDVSDTTHVSSHGGFGGKGSMSMARLQQKDIDPEEAEVSSLLDMTDPTTKSLAESLDSEIENHASDTPSKSPIKATSLARRKAKHKGTLGLASKTAQKSRSTIDKSAKSPKTGTLKKAVAALQTNQKGDLGDLEPLAAGTEGQ